MLGRLELESIRHRVVFAVAASRFNAAELEAIGYHDVRVIPPVVKPFRLLRTEPDPEMLHLLDREFEDPLLLFVGQLLPHKRPDLLVKAMHVAATYLGTQAVLLLVGQNRFARYADAVSAQVRELNLPQVHVVGSIDDARLAAMFRRATAFVTVSEHEGFCVPLLESLAFDVPVVARACAAIPETVGDAGLLLPAWAGAELVAGAIDRIVSRRETPQRPDRSRPPPAARAHRGRRERRDARSDRRGRLMRVLYVVQRYGDDIAGGAEQHARAFAERMVERDHRVTVLTTCARSYVNWSNAFPRGWSTANGVSVLSGPGCRRPQSSSVRPVQLAAEQRAERAPARTAARVDADAGSVRSRRSTVAPPPRPDVRRRRVHHLPVLADVGGIARVRGCGADPLAPDRARRASVAPVDLRGSPAGSGRLRVPHARRGRSRSRAFPRFATRRGRRYRGRDSTRPATPTRSGGATGSGADPYLLYVGRVDPAKGAAELIDYFVAYKRRNPSALRLVLLGELLVDDPQRHDVVVTGFVDEPTRNDALVGRTRLGAPVVLRELRDGVDRDVRAAPARARAAPLRGARGSRAPQRRRPSLTADSRSSRRRSIGCTGRPSSPTRSARPAVDTWSETTRGTS